MIKNQTVQARWLTLRQAAKYCGISKGTIEAWIRSGAVVSRKVVMPGNKQGLRLVEVASIDSFIESMAAN